jgi:hypothetical protein
MEANKVLYERMLASEKEKYEMLQKIIEAKLN